MLFHKQVSRVLSNLEVHDRNKIVSDIKMVRREKQSGIADDSEIATIASNTIGLRFDLSDKRTIVIFCIFDHETLLVFYANVALQKTKRLSCAVIDSAQNNLQELYETLESQAI